MNPFDNAASGYPAALPDCVASLSRDAFLEISRLLHGALPWPGVSKPGHSGGQTLRDRAAIAAVASLLPANAAEAELAAQFVLATAWARDCLRSAVERQSSSNAVRQCPAQAASLMRGAKSSLRLLLKWQADGARGKADKTLAGRAAQLEHAVAATMEEALA